jgi:predicted metal-binding protein
MSRHAFLSGYYKAFSYGAHRCRRCDACAVTDPESMGCRFPLGARPALESAGIAGCKTSQNAGMSTGVVLSKNVMEPAELPTFTLLLVE